MTQSRKLYRYMQQQQQHKKKPGTPSYTVYMNKLKMD